jgi:hypothetical protein
MPKKIKALSQEDQEYRDWQYHNSLSGRRCNRPDCEVPHHKNWSEEQDLAEKEARHEALEAKDYLRNRCDYHQERQVAKVEKDIRLDKPSTYLQVKVRINGREVNAIIDSGSHCNFMHPETVQKLGLNWGEKTDPYRVTGCDGQGLGETGQVTAETTPITYQIDQDEYVDPFDIMQMASHEIMLGMPWLQKYNPRVDWIKGTILMGEAPPSYGKAILQIIREENVPKAYKDLAEVFNDADGPELLPEHQDWDHRIPLIEGAVLKPEPLRPMSEEEAKLLREYIDTSKKKGWIEESTASHGYAPLFVKKKDGKMRTCIDYRDLNAKTKKDSYPLPLISEIQDRLTRAKIFTALDIREAYHQVRIVDKDKPKTTFRTRYRNYQYKVMPFRLTNAPASFQKLINNVLEGYLDIFCTVYLDDIIIFSENEEEHEEHVRKVILRLLK